MNSTALPDRTLRATEQPTFLSVDSLSSDDAGWRGLESPRISSTDALTCFPAGQGIFASLVRSPEDTLGTRAGHAGQARVPSV